MFNLIRNRYVYATHAVYSAFHVFCSMAETTGSLPKSEEQFAPRFTSEDGEYQQDEGQPTDPPTTDEDWGSHGGESKGTDNR